MSSAILYLAIVAIWAFLLVPRWIRRPHTASFAGAGNAGDGELSATEADSGGGGGGGAGAGAGADEPAVGNLGADAGGAESAGLYWRDDSAATGGADSRPGIMRSVGLVAAQRATERWQDETDSRADAEWRSEAGWRSDDQADDQAEPDTAPPTRSSQPEAGTADASDSGSESPGTGSAAPSPGARSAGPASVGAARPPISRSKILQARRRLLTTLVLLAVAAVTCTALKLTSWWVCVPPAGMLGMYVLLLREAAIADAERARRLAAEANAARQRARARSREAWAARTPQPSAEIIDISARLGDQLYDQYADATVRAVGD